VDLHVHTVASDGEYTPSQIVAYARQAGLSALAVTDHDTLASVAEAHDAAGGDLEVVSGVEITATFAGREVHLLGYFVRLDDPKLNTALARLRERRRERFRDYANKLADVGHPLPADRLNLTEQSTASLGRRHLASLLIACRIANNRAEAFQRFLTPLRERVIPKLLLPVEDAIALVHAAGGVTSLAHPHPDMTEIDYRALANVGLDAMEVEYPWGRRSRAAALREMARRTGLAVSGGSDSHGPDPIHRRIGSHGISPAELEILRDRRLNL
jgi:predicted metal-dependent phosphoesterase TrpH